MRTRTARRSSSPATTAPPAPSPATCARSCTRGPCACTRRAAASALAETVPDPALRPKGFTIEKGGLIDLEETTQQLVTCGYERVDQVEDRGQYALRGDIQDIYPAHE